MATISSHVLDAVTGRSAIGVRVDCARLEANGKRDQVFAVQTDQDGRISVAVETTPRDEDTEYELVFHRGEYFADPSRGARERSIMRCVVVRICMPDPDAKYHIPVIAAPHSYSVCWSA